MLTEGGNLLTKGGNLLTNRDVIFYMRGTAVSKEGISAPRVTHFVRVQGRGGVLKILSCKSYLRYERRKDA